MPPSAKARLSEWMAVRLKSGERSTKSPRPQLPAAALTARLRAGTARTVPPDAAETESSRPLDVGAATSALRVSRVRLLVDWGARLPVTPGGSAPSEKSTYPEKPLSALTASRSCAEPCWLR